MKSEKEIRDRINKIESFLELSSEIGGINYQKRSRLLREVESLKWVIEEREISGKLKGIIIKHSPVSDQIIRYLRSQKHFPTTTEICAHFGRDVRNSLKRLLENNKIKKIVKDANAHNPQRWGIKKNEI